jgi:hypothetical protein
MSDTVNELEGGRAHAAGVAICCGLVNNVNEHFDDPIPVLAGVLAAMVAYALQHGATEEALHKQIETSAVVAKEMPYLFEVAGNA